MQDIASDPFPERALSRNRSGFILWYMIVRTTIHQPHVMPGSGAFDEAYISAVCIRSFSAFHFPLCSLMGPIINLFAYFVNRYYCKKESGTFSCTRCSFLQRFNLLFLSAGSQSRTPAVTVFRFPGPVPQTIHTAYPPERNSPCSVRCLKDQQIRLRHPY